MANAKERREALERDMLALLPEQPRKGLMEWVMQTCLDNIGGDLTIFSRESYSPEDWLDWTNDTWMAKRRWAAACDCTACGERWYSAWGNDINGRPCIAMLQGDDGLTYEGWFDTAAPDGFTAGFTEGDYLECPRCGSSTQVIHASSLRNGRTYACQFGTVERIGTYGALLFWLVRRRVDRDGIFETEVWPRYALVLDAEGRLHAFGHTSVGQYGESLLERWERRSEARDPEQVRFYSHGNGYGQTARNTVGAVWWEDVPDIEGTTAEKTGIAEYIEAEGAHPALYLDLWSRHRNAENLVKAGLASILSTAIDVQAERATSCSGWIRHVTPPALRWEEKKPSRMLAVNREQLRQIAKQNWTDATAEMWVSESGRALRGVEPAEFGQWINRYGARSIGDLLRLKEEDGTEIGTAIRYLDRMTNVPSTETRARLLCDYRAMLRQELEGRAPTRDQLWPPHLTAAHDRAMEQRKNRADQRLVQSFKETAELYAPLQWSDGEICIVIPQREEDLIEEGAVLHHCVGGYGRSHIEGRPIFFVRHARRPERSWFTLNEDLRQMRPQRIQLHGYRNELFDSKAKRKNGFNRIPQRVLDFVARWEREILAPWQLEQKRAEREALEAKQKKRKRTRAAA